MQFWSGLEGVYLFLRCLGGGHARWRGLSGGHGCCVPKPFLMQILGPGTGDDHEDVLSIHLYIHDLDDIKQYQNNPSFLPAH